jgi:hypothetical protein
MTEIQFIHAILNLILPSIVIKNAILPSMEHNSSIIHQEIINLLLIMIRKIASFISAFESINFNVSESSTYKNIILEHIFKVSFTNFIKSFIQHIFCYLYFIILNY